MSSDPTDEAYERARKATPGDGEHRHNRPDCPGGFGPVYGSASTPGSDPDSLVCPRCGAYRRVESMVGQLT